MIRNDIPGTVIEVPIDSKEAQDIDKAAKLVSELFSINKITGAIGVNAMCRLMGFTLGFMPDQEKAEENYKAIIEGIRATWKSFKA